MPYENMEVSFGQNKETISQKFNQNYTNINNHDFTVTPWEVEGDIDYNKLIEKFGTFAINNDLIEKIRKITGDIHPFLKNKYFFLIEILTGLSKNMKMGTNFIFILEEDRLVLCI
ncbi:MAG: hypothetical protein ACTHLL_03005 [Candidatus Nitrosocosmicus sp.]